jgi:hypothetical protein
MATKIVIDFVKLAPAKLSRMMALKNTKMEHFSVREKLVGSLFDLFDSCIDQKCISVSSETTSIFNEELLALWEYTNKECLCKEQEQSFALWLSEA